MRGQILIRKFGELGGALGFLARKLPCFLGVLEFHLGRMRLTLIRSRDLFAEFNLGLRQTESLNSFCIFVVLGFHEDQIPTKSRHDASPGLLQIGAEINLAFSDALEGTKS